MFYNISRSSNCYTSSNVFNTGNQRRLQLGGPNYIGFLSLPQKPPLEQSQINLNEDQRSFFSLKPFVITVCYCRSQQAEESLEGLLHIQQWQQRERWAGAWEEVGRKAWGWGVLCGPGGRPNGFALNLSFCFNCFIWLIKSLKPRVPNLWDQMPNDLRWSYCNDRNKVTTSVMCSNHPETIPPPLVHGKIIFHETGLWCPKRLGTTVLSHYFKKIIETHSFPKWLSGKESACQCRRCRRLGFDCWARKIPWRRKWQPTPEFLLGKSHGQRSLAGYSSWSQKESDSTEHTCTHLDAHLNGKM